MAIVKKSLCAAAVAAFPCFTVAQEAAPTAKDIFTETRIPMSSVIEQNIENNAVLYAGRQCKLFSEAEEQYWVRLWAASTEVMFNDREHDRYLKELNVTPNLNKFDRRTQYFLKTGCGSPELVAKVVELKRRMEMVGYSLKKLTDLNAAAFMDLKKVPKD